MQWGDSRAVLWLYRFNAPQHSCATASGEEESELEELEEKDEMWKNVIDVFYALARFCAKERVSLSSV